MDWKFQGTGKKIGHQREVAVQWKWTESRWDGAIGRLQEWQPGTG